jgi:hypothetical protein
MAATLTKSLTFEGAELMLVDVDENPHVPMRPIVEALELDWSRQLQSIKADPVLSTTVGITPMVAHDGRSREMLTLPLDMLNGWLFRINAKRYRGERRERIMKYQRRCYRVLHDYWQGSRPSTPATVPNPYAEEDNTGAMVPRGQVEALHAHILAFGNETEYGTPSEVNGKPRTKAVHGYLRSSPKRKHSLADRWVKLTPDASVDLGMVCMESGLGRSAAASGLIESAVLERERQEQKRERRARMG